MAAPDKFRGTATAAGIASAVERACGSAGWSCDVAPVADGGEGTLEAFGGPNRRTTVRGPLGAPVAAEWRWRDGAGAVVEMARASGLLLVGGPEANDPLQATTYGTGELIAAALDAGARRVVVGAGGSATTDGGQGALSALRQRRRVPFTGVEVLVACDVSTPFVETAERFAPQKGATPAQVSLLRRRLVRLAETYHEDFGVDVTGLVGAGAAGGLAGGLVAAGARLVPGFELVAEELDLVARVAAADLVVTGEGRVDAESFSGKAAGAVVLLAARSEVPVLLIAGQVEPDVVPVALGRAALRVVDLVERFGRARAETDVTGCVEEVVAGHLAGR